MCAEEEELRTRALQRELASIRSILAQGGHPGLTTDTMPLSASLAASIPHVQPSTTRPLHASTSVPLMHEYTPHARYATPVTRPVTTWRDAVKEDEIK